jgi:hypothetical protein
LQYIADIAFSSVSSATFLTRHSPPSALSAARWSLCKSRTGSSTLERLTGNSHLTDELGNACSGFGLFQNRRDLLNTETLPLYWQPSPSVSAETNLRHGTV